MPETPLLALPVLEASQAQKHVTHNEALLILDAAIQLSVITRAATAPPASPADGDRYLLGSTPTGVWAGQGGKLAIKQSGGWLFASPREGWRLWAEDEDKLFAFDGTAWRDIQAIDVLSNVSRLGVNTTADAGNRLSVSSPAVLFSHSGNDHRVKINKQAASDTGSLLYQTGFSGRAEMGLAGDDNFHVKVSADGSTWNEALVVDRTTGAVTLPNTPGDNVYASRATLVAAVAGGLTRPDGTITHADGLAYRWKAGATMLPSLPGLVPAVTYTAAHFGAVADGTTSDTPAIQAAINAVFSNGGGEVVFGAGTYAVATGVTLKSGVSLRGSPRGTVIRPTAGFSDTGFVIINQNFTITDYTTRTDKDLGVDGIIFDGSLRPYVMYPASGYTNQGGMVLFGRCEQPFVRNCSFRDYRAGWGITSQGNRGAAFHDNEFLRMGKEDVDTGGIVNAGRPPAMRNWITAISQTNPCVITFSYPHSFGTGIKYLRGVRGMTQLADGEYNVSAVTSNTVTLGAVNATAYSAFAFDGETELTEQYGIRSEGTVITGNRFTDLRRLAVSDSGEGTTIANNYINGAGEAGFYLLCAKNITVNGNIIKNVALTDIVASGIEVNYGVNINITNNQFYRNEGNAIRISGMMGGRIAGNVCKESGKTAGLVYPNRPEAVAGSRVGLPIQAETRALVFITNYDDYPVDNIDISDNDFWDTRDGASLLTTYGIMVQRRTVDYNNRALRIGNNRFRGLLGLPEANWIYFATAAAGNGCWVEYQHPLTGRRVTIEASGTGYREIASPLTVSGAISLIGSGLSTFNELVDDRVGALLVAGSNITLTYNDAGNALTVAGTALSDGDKGDITVSGSGSSWTIDAGAITTAKLGGDVTAAGKALLTASDATSQTVLLNAFTSTSKGLVPASGGGTSSFLRADGTWASPSSGSDLTLSQYRRFRTLERTR